MKNNRLIFGRLIFGLAIYISSIGGAQAVSLTLNALNSPVTAGSQATFELRMDFTDAPTLGGGVDVVFGNFINGNQLSFVSYTPAALGDPFFYTPPNIPAVNAAGDRLEAITFGDIVNGVTGPALVGTLVFNTLVAGNYGLSLVDSVSAGGFFSISGAPQVPVYNQANLTVNPFVAPPAQAPEPATLWLLLIGLAGLSGMTFRPKAK
jgi:hypothetical protein